MSIFLEKNDKIALIPDEIRLVLFYRNRSHTFFTIVCRGIILAVMASAPTGRKIKAPLTSIETDEMEQIIPTRYTGIMGASPLKAMVKQGKNELQFEVVSDGNELKR